MRIWHLAWGIFSRMAGLGTGYGVLLGGIYGTLYFPVSLFLFDGMLEDLEFSVGTACFYLLLGFVIGAAFGMAWGLFLGIASGVVTASATALAPHLVSNTNLYLRVVRLLCLTMIGVSLSLMTVWPHSNPILWFLSAVVPALLAAWAFWGISENVTGWVNHPGLV
jgi:hypothetical protein